MHPRAPPPPCRLCVVNIRPTSLSRGPSPAAGPQAPTLSLVPPGPARAPTLCLRSNSTPPPGLSQERKPAPEPQRGWAGCRGRADRGPPEGQAQLEELVEPGAGPLARLFLTRAQRRPALPPRPGPGAPISSHPRLDRGGQGCMLGPGVTAPDKDAGSKATVRPHLRPVFLTLTLSQTEPPPARSLPKQTPRQAAVPRRQQRPGRRTPAWPPESHVTLLFREALERALFWVPKALILPETPDQGCQFTQLPKRPSE